MGIEFVISEMVDSFTNWKSKSMSYQRLFLLVFLGFSCFFDVVSQTLRLEDKVRIREAVHISELYGEQIWKGFDEVPFSIIFITDTIEFLLFHPNPTEDFTLLGYDSLLSSKVYFRPRQYPLHFLATFPAVNGLSCIVAGTPENTETTSIQWIMTMLHEHFHQYQACQPGYYESVDQLDLSGGDKSGMWMLNYVFPYGDTLVGQQYDRLTELLHRAIVASNDSFDLHLQHYLRRKQNFKSLLNNKDYKYFAFQVWQEGLARFTEYKFLKALSTYQPSKECLQLDDYVSFQDYGQELYEQQLNLLTSQTLDQAERICFYAFGFGEGLVLDRHNHNWYDHYIAYPFDTDMYFNLQD